MRETISNEATLAKATSFTVDVAAIVAVAAILVCGWVGKPVSVFDTAKASDNVNHQD